MNIGERIKQRRLELGLTVDDIADRLGKNRTTVYRYESNAIKDMPFTVLKPLAKVLDTTPAELLGLDDEEREIEAGMESARSSALSHLGNFFSDDYIELIELYDSLTAENKAKSMSYMEKLKNIQDMDFDIMIAAHQNDGVAEEQLKKDADKIIRKAKN